MIKLAMVIACSNLSTVVSEKDIVRSNTMLAMAEKKMPKALGEFGSSKYSDVTDKVLTYLNGRMKPATSSDLWKVVHKDLNAPSDLNNILLNLKTAEKIQVISLMGKTGYMPLNKIALEWDDRFLDLEWLTPQERLQ